MPTTSGNTVLVENARTGASEALILSTEALEFVADLVRTFRPRVKELLAKRVDRQARLDATGAAKGPAFLAETAGAPGSHARTQVASIGGGCRWSAPGRTTVGS